jgi:uncharacterized protein YkwD/PKD repeat protein
MLGAALFSWRPISSAVLYSGYARADSGPLTLEVTVTPPVGLPGDILQVNVRVTNRGVASLSPSAVVNLPRGVAADVFALPAGATFNLQENRIDWLPIVPAGGVVEFTLDAAVQAADVLTPEQDVVALLRHQGAEQETAARLWLGIAPLVGEVLAQGQVAVGQPVSLRAEIAGPGPIKTVWDLGDGRRLDLAEPEVVYPAAGQYEIVVEASNPGGMVSRRAVLTVLPHPVAAFRPEDDTLAVDQPAIFINNSGGQPPLNVFWDFGDGATLLGEQQPTHAYARAGAYRVRLTVENDFGRSEAVWDVTVGGAPVADMVIPDRIAVGLPLTGQAFGDEGVTKFIWDMGDGRGHEGESVSHFYRLPGDYYVSLTADNGHGQTQVGRWVRVDAGTSTLFLPLAAYQAGDPFAALSADAPAAADLDPAVETLTDVFVLDPIPFPAGTTPAEQLYAYLNAARARFQLPPMAYGFELSAAAQDHARDKARFPDNPHVGSDGTTAAERLLRSGYRGGYAGEATAWGFADPRLAVEFWINSDSHRPILLNRLGSEVGVGFVEDFASANVWHWTAEFGISYGAPARAVLRSQMPAAGYGALDTEIINYSWMWPLPLAAGEHFTVYLDRSGRLLPVGEIAQPVYGSRYVLSADARAALGAQPAAANYEWLVRLEDGRGQVIAESERRVVALTPDPAAAGPTPAPTTMIVTATPIAPTVMPTPTLPPTTGPPSVEPPPIIITATAEPSPTAQPSPTPEFLPTPSSRYPAIGGR